MKVNEHSRIEYHKRITSAMNYIQLNLAKNLRLETVAKAAHLSPFHFHKVFKLVVGETVADFTRRIRLEKAAGIFFYQKNLAITEIAIKLGFSSSQNLAKSFKRHFNLTPTEVKNLDSKEKLKQLIRENHKIGNTLNKKGNANEDNNLYSTSTLIMSEENTLKTETLKLVVTEFKARKVIYKRLIGEYGTGVQEAFTELHQFVRTRNISIAEPVYMVWDNPEITPAEKCRTDICITLNEEVKEFAPYNLQLIPAGKYAYIRAVLKKRNEYDEVWEQLFNKILDSGYQPEELPCFKILHTEKSNPQNGIFDVSVCAAIKPL